MDCLMISYYSFYCENQLWLHPSKNTETCREDYNAMILPSSGWMT